MVRRGPIVLAFVGLIWLGSPREAAAGMPSMMLTDIVGLRLQSISFFLLVLLLSAFGVQGIWNALTKDFPRLPRLSYKKAVGVMVLWGLLFTLILTMISGARELMTPGAWKKEGFLSKLATVPTSPADLPPVGTDAVRRGRIERLYSLLAVYARARDGAFPLDDTLAIPAEAWQLPDPSEMRYLYVRGRKLGEVGAILAYEPGLYGSSRYVVFADGEIRVMSVDELRKGLQAEAR